MVPAFMEPGTKTTVTSAQDHRHIVIIIISHSVTDSQTSKVLTMKIKIHCTSKTKQIQTYKDHEIKEPTEDTGGPLDAEILEPRMLHPLK